MFLYSAKQNLKLEQDHLYVKTIKLNQEHTVYVFNNQCSRVQSHINNTEISLINIIYTLYSTYIYISYVTRIQLV